MGDEGRLKHNGHVGGVEEFDRISALLSTEPVALDGQFNTEPLEVDNEEEDGQGREEIHHVGQIGTIKGFLEGAELVGSGE